MEIAQTIFNNMYITSVTCICTSILTKFGVYMQKFRLAKTVLHLNIQAYEQWLLILLCKMYIFVYNRVYKHEIIFVFAYTTLMPTDTRPIKDAC